MDPQVVLKTIDNTYSLSKQYPNQMFAVTSTKHALVLHATTGEQFHILRSCFFDNELTLLDMALHRASESRTNLIYYTSQDSNTVDNFDEQMEGVMTLEQVLKNIDNLHSLSKRYPDQLFSVEVTPFTIVLHSNEGEKFDIMRSSLSVEEVSLVENEFKKASAKSMELIYRTSNLDEVEEEDMEIQHFDCIFGDPGYYAYSTEEVARMRRRMRSRNLNNRKPNQPSLKIEYRKRKAIDEVTETHLFEKRQRFDM